MARLSDMVNRKVEISIENLGSHGVTIKERAGIDHEIVPIRLPSPDGNGYITAFFVSLSAPSDVLIGDHVIHDGILYDPYIGQESVDALVYDVYKKVLEEKEEAAKEIPAGIRQPPVPKEARSRGGLYIPRG